MDSILRLTRINYSYPSLLEQQRANALMLLSRLAIGLAGAVLVVLVMLWSNSQNVSGLLLMVPMLVITASAALYIANQGQLPLASWIYVGASIIGPLILVATTGLKAQTMMSLALPFFVAGLLLDERGILIVTGSLIGGLLVVGGLEVTALRRVEGDLLSLVLEPVLLMAFFGAAEWALLRQVRSSFDLITHLERNQNASYELSDIMGEADSVDGLLREVALRAQRSLDLHQVQIFLTDENNPGMLRLRAAAGLAAQRALLDERTISLAADQVLTTAAKTQEPMVGRMTDLANIRAGFFSGTYAELAIPLLDGQRLLGVIDFQSAFVDAFDVQAVEASVLIGRQLALVLRNLRLSTQLGQASAEQAQLQRHIAQLSTEMQRVRSQTSGTVWEEFFRTRDKRTLGFDFVREDPEPVTGQELTPTITQVMDSGLVHLETIPQGHRLTIPILLRGEVLGAMTFDIQRSGMLPERLIELASTVAERLSLSLDNARLVEQAQAVAYRERQVSNISGRLQATGSIEELVTLAAAEFSEALDGALTHIRMQITDDSQSPQALAANASPAGQHEGGAA